MAFTKSVVSAAVTSDSWDEFADKGEDAFVATVKGAAEGAFKGYMNKLTCCFIAGTLVMAEEGNVPIEQIQAGDLVWAWDEETGDVALKPVVETYANETSELTHVFVDGEEIVATPTHPFYCPTKGWTDAAQLRAGDILVLVNGEYVVVEWVQHELLESPVRVYNFQVEDYHTYYVASGVLVHNKCGDIDTYNNLRRSNSRSGNEAHHIIEKRFARLFGQNPGEMQSIMLAPEQHRVYTNAWRQAIPYGSKNVSASDVIGAAKKIYAGSKTLLDIVDSY